MLLSLRQWSGRGNGGGFCIEHLVKRNTHMRSLRPLATYELESEVGNNLQSEPTFNTDNNAHRMFLYTSSNFRIPCKNKHNTIAYRPYNL